MNVINKTSLASGGTKKTKGGDMKRTLRRTVLLKGGGMKRTSREIALLKGRNISYH